MNVPILVSAISISFSLSFAALAQEVKVVTKAQPIKEVTYEWNNNNNLVVKVFLNYKKLNEGIDIGDSYFLQRDMAIKMIVNGHYNQLRIADNVEISPEDEGSEPLKFTLDNLKLMRADSTPYKNPIRTNQWSYFTFKFLFKSRSGNDNDILSLEFPLYKEEINIPSPGNPVKLTSNELFFNEKTVRLHFNSNTPDFEYEEIELLTNNEKQLKVGTFIADHIENVRRGTTLKAHFDIAIREITDGDALMINVTSSTGQKFTLIDKVLKETEFTALSFEIKKGDKFIPFSNALTFDKQKLEIRVQTNAIAGSRDFDLTESKVSLELIRDPVELHQSLKRTIHELKIDESGMINFNLDLTGLNDGLYRMKFGSINDNFGKPKSLTFKKQPYLTLDSKNTLNDLQFSYSPQSVRIDFKLSKTVPENRVFARNKGSGEIEPSAAGEREGYYTIDISRFERGAFNAYEILVSFDTVFDFSFKVVSEEEIHNKVKETINTHIANVTEGERGKEALEYLKSQESRDKLKTQILSEVKAKIVTGDDLINPAHVATFSADLEAQVETTIQELVGFGKKALNNKSFWETTLGKITKVAGRLAGRYLGIIVA